MKKSQLRTLIACTTCALLLFTSVAQARLVRLNESSHVIYSDIDQNGNFIPAANPSTIKGVVNTRQNRAEVVFRSHIQNYSNRFVVRRNVSVGMIYQTSAGTLEVRSDLYIASPRGRVTQFTRNILLSNVL